MQRDTEFIIDKDEVMSQCSATSAFFMSMFVSNKEREKKDQKKVEVCSGFEYLNILTWCLIQLWLNSYGFLVEHRFSLATIHRSVLLVYVSLRSCNFHYFMTMDLVREIYMGIIFSGPILP